MHNGMEKTSVVANVMDEHPKDLGTLACKNRGDVSHCGQQVCVAPQLRDAAGPRPLVPSPSSSRARGGAEV